MTTATLPKAHTQAPVEETYPVHRDDTFHTVGSEHSLGENLPQRAGSRLWLPMFVLALMGWTVGMILALTEATTDRSETGTLQDLSHLVPGFMFIGFLGVFSAITFAVARILGAFRQGGGDVQETSGCEVQTLKMPGTAKLMLVLMAMGMMVMGAGIVTSFVAAGSFEGVSPTDITDNAAWAAAAGGLRRMGVALYLTGIAFGLGTIIEVLRFQAIRIQEVATAHGHEHH
jgi:hypothetical protein